MLAGPQKQSQRSRQFPSTGLPPHFTEPVFRELCVNGGGLVHCLRYQYSTMQGDNVKKNDVTVYACG